MHGKHLVETPTPMSMPVPDQDLMDAEDDETPVVGFTPVGLDGRSRSP